MCLVAVLALCIAAGLRTLPAVSSNPQLRDVNRRVQIGPGFDGEVSAPTITRGGKVIGVYIDDTTPNRDYWVRKAAAKYVHGLVLVGIGMGEDQHYHLPNVVEMKEWYPYNSGSSPQSWGPIPRYPAYACQWSYDGFNGHKPPTVRQRVVLLAKLKLKRPKLLLLY